MIFSRRRARVAVCSFAVGLALMGGALTACGPTDAAAAQQVVGNAEEFRAALRNAKGGASILLSPGAYGDITIRNFNRGSTVVIASARPDALASLSSLSIEGSSDLLVRSLDVRPAGKAGVVVASSKRVRFEEMQIQGRSTAEDIGLGNGLVIRKSNDVAVMGSEFRNLGNALSHRDSGNLLIEKNKFYDIRVDGIHGSGSSDVVISKNAFWNFSRRPGEHPDAVQFWTTNATASARNISILDNLIIRSEGGRMQGLFITDQTKGRLPYENLVVRGNAIVGSMFHGIAVSSATAPVIEGNLVLGFDDAKAWIAVDRSTDAVVKGNQATAYRLNNQNANLQRSDNKTIPTPRVGDTRVLSRWLAAKGNDLPRLPATVLASVK